jgi:hypothetical protein
MWICGQREQQADVWFAAHQMLYEPPPRALSKAWLTWTDETSISAALIGTSSDDEEVRCTASHYRFFENSGGPLPVTNAQKCVDLRACDRDAGLVRLPGVLRRGDFKCRDPDRLDGACAPQDERAR